MRLIYTKWDEIFFHYNNKNIKFYIEKTFIYV